MARTNLSSASNWLSDVSPLNATPFTVAGWFRCDTAAQYDAWVLGDTTAGANYWVIYLNGGSIGGGGQVAGSGNTAYVAGQVDIEVINGVSTVSQCPSLTTFTANTWNHVAAVMLSSTSRTIYLNGGGSQTDVFSVTPTAGQVTNNFFFGYRIGSTTFGPMVGTPTPSLAEWGLWNQALAVGQIQQLAAGALPWQVQPDALKGYWMPRADSGVSKAFDMNPFRPRKFDLTINGTLPLDTHPPKMQYPAPARRRRLTNLATASLSPAPLVVGQSLHRSNYF